MAIQVNNIIIVCRAGMGQEYQDLGPSLPCQIMLMQYFAKLISCTPVFR